MQEHWRIDWHFNIPLRFVSPLLRLGCCFATARTSRVSRTFFPMQVQQASNQENDRVDASFWQDGPLGSSWAESDNELSRSRDKPPILQELCESPSLCSRSRTTSGLTATVCCVRTAQTANVARSCRHGWSAVCHMVIMQMAIMSDPTSHHTFYQPSTPLRARQTNHAVTITTWRTARDIARPSRNLSVREQSREHPRPVLQPQALPVTHLAQETPPFHDSDAMPSPHIRAHRGDAWPLLQVRDFVDSNQRPKRECAA